MDSPFRYRFPTITHINDVLPHIEGCDEIVVAERGFFKVINYVMITSDTFRPPELIDGEWKLSLQSAIRRECRGLIFDGVTGKLVRRPHHKFFNLGERMETEESQIELSYPHRILSKADGSMIAPFITSDGIFRVGTKMGETSIADMAKPFFDNASNYRFFSRVMINQGMTPVFEYMAPDNQIVVFHPEAKLVLTAARRMQSGEYINYDYLKDVAYTYDIPVIEDVTSLYQNDTKAIAAQVKNIVNDEGVVITFDDGHKVKVKGDWYLAIHKMKDNILYERFVIELILDDKIDDVIPHLTEQDKDRIINYTASFEAIVVKQTTDLRDRLQFLLKEGIDKKEYAIKYSSEDKDLKALVFNAYADKTLDAKYDASFHDNIVEYAHEQVCNLWRKQLISNSKLAEFKQRNGDTGWKK